MPFVITANSTPDGSALFLVDESTWSTDLAKAQVVDDEAQRDRLVAVGQASQKVVSDPYAIAVEIKDGQIHAVEYREQIRAKGPTVAMIGQTSRASSTAGAPL